MKKIISSIIALTMCLLLFNVAVNAQNEELVKVTDNNV